MRFVSVAETGVFEFIGLYIPMVLVVLLGIIIAKIVKKRFVTWVFWAFGIAASAARIVQVFLTGDASTTMKVVEIVVLLLIAAALWVAVYDVDINE